MGGPGSGRKRLTPEARLARQAKREAQQAVMRAEQEKARRVAKEAKEAEKGLVFGFDQVAEGGSALWGSRWASKQKMAIAEHPHNLPWDAPGLSRFQRVIRFLQELTITSGTEEGKLLTIRPFQREFLQEVYREDHGHRPVRTAVMSMARKNGKSQLAAGLALCHLCGPESESRGEVYSCANDRFQSSKIFHEMCALIRGHSWLRARTNILFHQKVITDLITGSIYVALSRDARTKMGLSPSFCIYDELGQALDDSLYRAMDSAMGARRDPLMMVISTQAADDLAPLSRLIDYGLKIKAGIIEDPSFHLTLFAADMADDPWDPASWKKANPALGDFRSLEDVERQALQAKRIASQENSFRNLILNQRIAAEARFIEREQWAACAGEAKIPPGARVYGAVDLGSTRDMSALVLIHQDVDGIFHVEPHFWLPGDPIERSSEDRAPYDVWVRDGLLNRCGESTDPALIARKIAELNGKYRIQFIAFDRWRIGDLQRELTDIGCSVQLVGHGQGFKDMTPAVDVLERFVFQKRIRHGDNPVLAMNVSHAVITRDAANGRKLDKAKSNGRIDGLVALAMAFSIAVIKGTKPVDVTTMIV
jgi:phage terminase large subunit-like protein